MPYFKTYSNSHKANLIRYYADYGARLDEQLKAVRWGFKRMLPKEYLKLAVERFRILLEELEPTKDTQLKQQTTRAIKAITKLNQRKGGSLMEWHRHICPECYSAFWCAEPDTDQARKCDKCAEETEDVT